MWRRMGRFTLTVHTERVPSDEEWAQYISQVRDHMPLEEQRALVVSAGGSPSGMQRKAMVTALNGAKVPVAILTNSILMRSAATAVSWFNPQLKVFGPSDLEPAIDYLQLTPWERTETRNTLAEFQEKLKIDVARRPAAANG